MQKAEALEIIAEIAEGIEEYDSFRDLVLNELSEEVYGEERQATIELMYRRLILARDFYGLTYKEVYDMENSGAENVLEFIKADMEIRYRSAYEAAVAFATSPYSNPKDDKHLKGLDFIFSHFFARGNLIVLKRWGGLTRAYYDRTNEHHLPEEWSSYNQYFYHKILPTAIFLALTDPDMYLLEDSKKRIKPVVIQRKQKKEVTASIRRIIEKDLLDGMTTDQTKNKEFITFIDDPAGKDIDDDSSFEPEYMRISASLVHKFYMRNQEENDQEYKGYYSNTTIDEKFRVSENEMIFSEQKEKLAQLLAEFLNAKSSNPELDRDLLMHLEYGEIEELAEKYNQSEGTLRRRRARLIKRLKDYMRKW